MAKRTPKGSGSIRLRSDGRWEARYTLGFDKLSGKQIQKSIYGKTKAEVSKKLRKILSDVDSGKYSEPSKMPLSEWLEEWINTYCNSIKESTKQTYRSTIKNHISNKIGRIKLCDLDATTVQKLYNGIIKSGTSNKTLKNIHGILHKALEQAIKIDYIDSNVADKVNLPKVNKPEIRPLESEEIIKLFNSIDNINDLHLIRFAIFTGMRMGEILALTWDDVDFNNSFIRVSKQLSMPRKLGDKYKVTTTKNSKTRYIKPSSAVFDILYLLKEEQLSLNIYAPYGEYGNLVFCKADGSNYTRQNIFFMFKKYLKMANIEGIRFHDLRHTYAVNALRAGDDPKTVSENLGHATVSFTLDVYAALTKNMQTESAKRMDKFLEKSGFLQ